MEDIMNLISDMEKMGYRVCMNQVSSKDSNNKKWHANFIKEIIEDGVTVKTFVNHAWGDTLEEAVVNSYQIAISGNGKVLE